MEQKHKFILLGLVGLSIVFIFLYIQTLNSKQLILRERDDLKQENTALNAKFNELETRIKNQKNKIDQLNKDLEKASREKQEIDKKLELVNKEKTELIEAVESLKSKPVQQTMLTPQLQIQPQTQAQPPEADTYWAGILKVKTDLELQLASLRDELRQAQIMNEQLQREKTTLGLDMNNLQRENQDLKRQLDYNQKIIDSVSMELVAEKNDKIKIQEAFKSIKSENKILVRQLKRLNERKVILEKKLQELQEKNARIEEKFTGMQTMLVEKVSQISDLKDELEAIRTGAKTEQALQEKKESVELPPIVVRPQPEASAPSAAVATLTGKILAINKDKNFVIIDLGEEAGVAAGDSFQVYRDGNSIATIEVIQTRKNIAACDIEKQTSPIKVGDIVR